MSKVTINSATGTAWDELGKVIVGAGREDASGSRRYYAHLLAEHDYSRVTKDLKITEERAREIRSRFVSGFGEA